MSENEMSLVMRIRSLFDGSGAKAAADAQTELAAKSKTATAATAEGTKNLQQAGQVASRAAEQISTVATAMGNTGGAAGQAAAGVRLLSGAIQTLTTAGGGLKGLLAAVALLATSALVNWLVKTAAKTKELNEQAGKTNDALTAMSKITLDAINAQQDKLRKSASDTADQYERILQAKNRMLSSQEQADLAQNDYEKAVDLSRAPKDDQFAARRIEAEYAAKAAAISQEAERQRKNNEVAIADNKLKNYRDAASSYDNEANNKEAVQAVNLRRLEEMQRQKSAAEKMAAEEKARLGSLMPGAGQKYEDKAGKLADQIGNLQAAIVENTKQIKEDREKAAASRDQAKVAEWDAMNARTDRAGGDIRNRATGQEQQNAESSINYEQKKWAEETIKKNRTREKEINDELKEKRDKTTSEWSDVVLARRGAVERPKDQSQVEAMVKGLVGVGKGDGSDISELAKALREGIREGKGGGDAAKELKEYQEARKQEAEFKEKVLEELKKQRQETAKALEALKNLPNN